MIDAAHHQLRRNLGMPRREPRHLPAVQPVGNPSTALSAQVGANDHIATIQASAVVLSNPTRRAASNC